MKRFIIINGHAVYSVAFQTRECAEKDCASLNIPFNNKPWVVTEVSIADNPKDLKVGDIFQIEGDSVFGSQIEQDLYCNPECVITHNNICKVLAINGNLLVITCDADKDIFVLNLSSLGAIHIKPSA